MDRNVLSEFGQFLDTQDVSEKQKNDIMQMAMNLMREVDLDITVNKDVYDNYLDHIIEMFTSNPGLDKETYKQYISFVFSKIQEKVKFVKIY